MQTTMIKLPSENVEKLFWAAEQFASAQDALEDYLFMGQKKLVSVLSRARRQHRAGKTRDIRLLARRYGV